MLSTILIIDKRKELSTKYKKSIDSADINAVIARSLQDAIAFVQELLLSMAASPPDRTHRMDHMLGRQAKTIGDYSLSGGTAANSPAVPVKLLVSGSSKDGAAHSASGRQAAVSRIDDSINR